MRRVADPQDTPVRPSGPARWPASNRNSGRPIRNHGRHQIGIPGRRPSEFALVMPAVARGVHLSESNRSPRARISFWTGIGSSSTRGMRRGRPAGRLGCAGMKTAGGGSSELSSSAAIDWAKKVAFGGIGLMVTSSISRSKSAPATAAVATASMLA